MEFIGLILPALAILLLVIIVSCGYIKAPPDMAYIISGIRKKPRVLIGQAGIKIPFFERMDKLSLGAVQIDVKTRTAVPTAEYINVRVDSTVAVRVGRTDEMIALAAQNFLNINRETIGTKINDLLEGNVREIVGQMKLTEMVSDRKAFSDKVQANVVPDLAKFGLELVSFNVQNFSDEGGVIDNLGIDNVEQIRKGAAIAKSNATREIAEVEAQNDKAMNEARVNAATEVAEKQTEFAIKKAKMQEEADTAQAKADAAKKIEAENQRKQHEIATANANLARQEKEIELKEREVAITERKLEAEIKKKAENTFVSNTLNNHTVLSTYAKVAFDEDVKAVSDLFAWITKSMHGINEYHDPNETFADMMRKVDEDPKMKSFFLQMIKKADFNIVDFHYEDSVVLQSGE